MSRPKTIVGIASLATREASLQRTVESLAPQVDAICVYLNGYKAIPRFLANPKVLYAVLSHEAVVSNPGAVDDEKIIRDGHRAGDAKFWFFDPALFRAVPAPWDPDAIALTCDDDIVYPPNYVARMADFLAQHPKSIVAVHGSVLDLPIESWRNSRRCAHFTDAVKIPTTIHVPGTGTMAWRVGDFEIDMRRDFEWSHMCDISIARAAVRQDRRIWMIDRPQNWLIGTPTPADGSSVCDQRIAARNDVRETLILQSLDLKPIQIPTEVERLEQMRRVARREAVPAAVKPTRFDIVVTGWNCADSVRRCWESIKQQTAGAFSWRAFLLDDGSTDGTADAMRSLPDDSRLVRIYNDQNRGAAFSRWRVLKDFCDDPGAVCVLVDLDDWLESGALARVAAEYHYFPRTWATYGAWRPMDGQPIRAWNSAYPADVIAKRSYRQASFRFGPLRTFRRFLVDRIPETNMQHPDGSWVMACTDVALCWSVLEQIGEPDRLRYIRDFLYRYNWNRPGGTLDRFGGKGKNQIRAMLAEKQPLPIYREDPRS